MKLQVDNQILGGFTEVHVQSSMATIFDQFQFIASRNRGFKIGQDAIVLAPDESQLVEGYIDGLEIKIGSTVSIYGRDKTADLTACTIAGTGEFKGLTVKSIIERICEPFGITVTGEAPATIDVFRYGLNEKVIDIIRDLLSRYALLANSDGNGNLRIESLGSERAELILKEGNNIISGAISLRESRYSTLTANGQGRASNNASTATGNASRYRPNVVTCSGIQLAGQVSNSATWMLNLAQPEVYKVSVSGIYDIRPNTLISIDAPTLGVDGDLLVYSTGWHMDKRGHTTEFELVNPLKFGGDDAENTWIF